MSIRFFATALAASLALPSFACAPPPPPRRAASHTTSATIDRSAVSAALAAGGPATVEAMLTRETTIPLKDFRVRAADGALELHVKAVAAPIVKTRKLETGGSYTIATFSIGSEIDVVCNASSAPLDIAHWAEEIVSSMKVKLGAVPSVRVEAPESHPLMFIDTDGALTDERDGKLKRNIAKFAGVHLDGGSITCAHDGIGYRETFTDLMRHIASKTKSPGAAPPTFREVSVINDGEAVIGFAYQRRWAGEKKGEWHEGSLSSVILHDERAWAAADSGWHGVVDGRGVVSERAMKRIGKVTVVDMKLERKKGTSYAFEGTVEGTPKRGTFTSRAPLVTILSRTPLLAALVRDPKKKEAVFFHFDENTPEKGALKEVARRTGASSVRLEEDGKAYEAMIDARGIVTRFQRSDSERYSQSIAIEGGL